MKYLKLFLLGFLLCWMGNLQAQKQDSVRVLWIGNSFTFVNDLPKMVQQISATQNIKLSCARALEGGQKMAGHLKNKRLLQMLKDGGWDYVVIQEQSTNPSMPTRRVVNEVYPFAKQLVEKAREGSPETKVVFYMTWGHKEGSQENVADYPLDDTYESMQDRLITSYLEMANENDAWCAPVGMAWKKVRQERPECVLYMQDMSHPSVKGSYLAANVLFTTLFQRHYQTDYVPEGVVEAEYLQQVAQHIVFDNLHLLNIEKGK